jgi:hypothetical protein
LTVARVVVLDAWPLGLASHAKGKPERDRCRAWLYDLDLAGVLVVAPEVADFEVRRELIRTGARSGIVRLDSLLRDRIFLPITTPAMRLAATFWAHVRQAGIPTAGDESLDADCILAAQAVTFCGQGDIMTIATRNVAHLSRFSGIDAREWETITR